MRHLLVSFFLCLLLSSMLPAQKNGIKSYSSYEDYCADNPHAPTCVNGKPLKFDAANNPLLKGPQVKVLTPPQATSSSSQTSRATSTAHGQAHPGPSIIEVPGGTPTPAQLAAVKTLGLHADWRFADPHAEMLMGLNAAALRQSPTLRALLLQLAPSLKLTAEDIDNQLRQVGEVDQLWISIRSGEALMLLMGPRAVAPAGPTSTANGMVVYGISHGAVLLGHSGPAAAAVQRLRSTSGVASSAALQMKAQGAESDIWAMGTQVTLQQAKLQSAGLANGLSSFLLGVNLRDGLKVDLKLNYTTAAAARRALANMQASPPPPDWPVRVSSSALGPSVRFKATVSQAELSQALDKAVATPAAKPVLEMLAKSMQRSNQAVVSGPGGTKIIQTNPTTQPPPDKLVIYGLPGGPKVM